MKSTRFFGFLQLFVRETLSRYLVHLQAFNVLSFQYPVIIDFQNRFWLLLECLLRNRNKK